MDFLHSNKRDVYIQDQTSPFINWFLTKKIATVTLSVVSVREATIVTLTPGHGVVVGNFLEFWEGSSLHQTEVINVATNDITLAKPLPTAFTTSATVYATSAEMNVNGSVTPVDFTFAPKNSSWDLKTISALMSSGSASDDSNFGGIAALTKGVLVGKINSDLSYDAYPYNMKKNGCFKLHKFDALYTDKAGGGAYGTDISKNLSVTTGVASRINKNQYIFARVRDDLSTLTSFRVMLIFHLVV